MCLTLKDKVTMRKLLKYLKQLIFPKGKHFKENNLVDKRDEDLISYYQDKFVM